MTNRSVRMNSEKQLRTQKVREITGNPEGSREERRAARKLGVEGGPLVEWPEWERFAPDEDES